MIRVIGIALVILGLIAQPLIADMRDSMHCGETTSSVSMDGFDLDVGMSEHRATGGDQPSPTPCHGTAAEETAPIPCTDCDGACVSACSLGTLAVLNQSSIKFERLSVVRVVGASGALVLGLPSRIFHPPKHA